MGWASGSNLADKVWIAISPLLVNLPDYRIQEVARDIVSAFRQCDCDTMEECEGVLGDMANRMDRERYGAPVNPTEGCEYKDRWGETHRFDGKRWRCVD